MRSIGLGFNIYISNKIGSEAVGIFSLVMSVYSFAITIATSGIGLAATCLVAEDFAIGDNNKALKTMRTCIILSLLLGIISATLIILGANKIAEVWLHGQVSSKPIYFVAIGLPFIAISSSINGYFSAVRKAYKTATSQLFELIIKIIATVFLLNIFISKGVEYICIALIGADVISEIFSFTYIYILYIFDKRKYYIKRNNVFDCTKRILKISLPFSITSYIRSGLSTLKQLIIPIRLEKYGLSCATALSQYGLISGMVMPVIMFPCTFINSFSSLLIPEFSSYYANKNFNSINYVCTKIFKITSLFSIGIASIFFYFSNEISLAIYQNLDSSIFIKIFAPLIFFMYMDSVIDGILKGLKQQISVMCCNILDLIISISFIYYLLPIQGIRGYVIVIYISEILNFSISIYQLFKFSNLKFKFIDWIIKPIFASTISFSILNIFYFNCTNEILQLIINICIFIIIFTLTSISISLYDKKYHFFVVKT